MKYFLRNLNRPLFLVLTILMMTSSCATRKKKGDVSKFKKFYHNVTSEYNGYFNANELLKFSMITLQENNNDNYSDLIEVYDYVSVSDPQLVYADLDIAIEKVTRVAALHEPGEWVDDCYVLMGTSQYLKQDYETALETFEYFEDDFNPANPYGRNYVKRKNQSKSSKKKEQNTKRKEAQKERKTKEKERQKEREALKKEREQARKERSRSSNRATASTRKSSGKKKKQRGTKKRPVRTPRDTSSQIASTTVNPVTNKTPIATTPAQPKAKEVAKEKTPPKKNTRKNEAGKNAYYEGLVWLAKTYTRVNRYSDAEFMLDRINSFKGHNKKVREEIYPAYADLMIKQEKYEKALEYLDLAIAGTKSKRKKARYAYVAGQLSQLENDNRGAMDYFNIARKNSGKDYKMKFMADLSKIKNGMMAGGRSGSDARGKLEKMLNEDKNAEFKDQIYYALAEIELNRGNLNEGLAYLKSSIANNTNDQALKAESYYTIADLSFSNGLYVDAKLYFDSTVINLDKGDERMVEVLEKQKNLEGIAKNLMIVERLDSLFALAELSPKELKKIAKDILEANGKSANNASNDNSDKGAVKAPSSKRRAGMKSSFFAYNLVTLETGKKQFKNKWGNRPLEDNWRRSSKSINLAADLPEEVADNEEAAVEKDQFSDEEINRILADIPTTPEQKAKYNKERADAQYALGKLFRDKIKDFPKGIEAHEALINIAPDYDKKLDAYYYLYLSYLDIGNIEQSNKYKNLITSEFKDSKYAQIILDPTYAETLVSEDQMLENYYQATFDLYNSGNHQEVNKRYIEAGTKFGKDNRFMPRFALVNAMSMGSLEGKNAYIRSLNELIIRYPNTPETTRAKEIMRLIKGDQAAFNSTDIEEVDNIFSEENNARHYVTAVIFSYDDKILQQAKVSTLNFNKEYFKLENLKIGQTILSKDEKTQIILIRSFDNKEDAMKYYNVIAKDKNKFISSDLVEFEAFAITQRNYRKLIQQKTHSSYRVFFENHYLDN